MGACSMRSNPARGRYERNAMAFLKGPDPLKDGFVLPRRSLWPVWIKIDMPSLGPNGRLS